MWQLMNTYKFLLACSRSLPFLFVFWTIHPAPPTTFKTWFVGRAFHPDACGPGKFAMNVWTLVLTYIHLRIWILTNTLWCMCTLKVLVCQTFFGIRSVSDCNDICDLHTFHAGHPWSVAKSRWCLDRASQLQFGETNSRSKWGRFSSLKRWLTTV